MDPIQLDNLCFTYIWPPFKWRNPIFPNALDHLRELPLGLQHRIWLVFSSCFSPRSVIEPEDIAWCAAAIGIHLAKDNNLPPSIFGIGSADKKLLSRKFLSGGVRKKRWRWLRNEKPTSRPRPVTALVFLNSNNSTNNDLKLFATLPYENFYLNLVM